MKELERIAVALEKIAESLGALGKNSPTAPDVRQRRREAGLRSAEARKQRYGTAQPRTNAEQNSNKLSKVDPESANQTKFLIGVYCEAFKTRYGANPVITGKTAGQARQLLKAIPLGQASELVQAFLQMEDNWFKLKCHDFGVLVQSLNQVKVALKNGTSTPHEKSFWDRVFGKGESNSEATNLPGAGEAPGRSVGRQELLRAGDRTAVAVVPGRLR